MSEWQATLFHFIHSLPMKDEPHTVVIASPMNDIYVFIRTKNVLFNIVYDINDGVLKVSRHHELCLQKRAARQSSMSEISKNKVLLLEDTVPKVQLVLFHDWLKVYDDWLCPQSG